MGEQGTKRTVGIEQPSHAAWHRFLDVMLAHKEQFTAKLAKFDLNPPQAFLLRSIAPGSNVLMCHIASALSCDASNVTNLVDRLETRGLIERQSDPSDRRVRRIVLTRAGARLRAQLLEDAFAPPPSLGVLSAAELKQFEQILQKILAAHAAGCGCPD
jgi:MarR family transcriptional regulator, organic hydroperoxide resistance regulator